MNLCNGKIKEDVECNHCGAINKIPYSDYADIECKIVVEYVQAIGTCWKCKQFFSHTKKRNE
jgi:hypothetical protein